MPSLLHFGLFGNCIGCKEDEAKNNKILKELINVIKERCPKLEELYIEENEICNIQSYEDIIKSELKFLKVFNGELLSITN